MITIERTSVMNFENAIRGARNPMNSWNRMDSFYDEQGNFIMGPNDLNLAQRLARAGSDHRKFIRQIFVSVDFTAPLYWWKEYDTYRWQPWPIPPPPCTRLPVSPLRWMISPMSV